MEFKALVTDKLIYKKYVEILNSLFGLAEREMDVFASLLRIHMEWGIDEPKDIIDTRSRKKLMKEALINKNNLSKYIGKLKDLKIVVYNKDKDGWVINQSLVPTFHDVFDPKGQVIHKNVVNINFILQLKDNE
jgi:hypothetical protein